MLCNLVNGVPSTDHNRHMAVTGRLREAGSSSGVTWGYQLGALDGVHRRYQCRRAARRRLSRRRGCQDRRSDTLFLPDQNLMRAPPMTTSKSLKFVGVTVALASVSKLKRL